MQGNEPASLVRNEQSQAAEVLACMSMLRADSMTFIKPYNNDMR